MKQFLMPFLLFLLSCTSDKKDQRNLNSEKADYKVDQNKIRPSEILDKFVDTLEVFSDSLLFGQKKKNKITITKISNQDSTFTTVQLFTKKGLNWEVNDEICISSSAIPNLDVSISDFNADGFPDLLFTSGESARGANVVQTLMLYEPKKQKLRWIKNSELFPNLMYNKELKCVDALIFTGGLTTVFLRLEKDSLIEFAEVDQRDDRITVKKVNANGQEKEIKNIKNKGFSDMTRFINFDPLKERKKW